MYTPYIPLYQQYLSAHLHTRLHSSFISIVSIVSFVSLFVSFVSPMIINLFQSTYSPFIPGKPLDFPSFGWDNEYGTETVNVAPFEASKNMVSNGDFFRFVKAGACYIPSPLSPLSIVLSPLHTITLYAST